MDSALLADGRVLRALADEIAEVAAGLSGETTLMEVCGTHTHAIAQAGLRRMLPDGVRLISGPGCPVCVTPVRYVDHAEALAARPEVTVCTFGDLLRVPSSHGSLELARAQGGDVRVVYSPRDALAMARTHPQRTVVFLAVGFETTVPTIAAALEEAEATAVANFMILSGNKIVPPPLRVLAEDPDIRLDGLLLPGHVSVITGSDAFSFLADAYGMPAVVVGFAPADVLMGVRDLLQQRRVGKAEVRNLYGRIVTGRGNERARALVDKFFAPGEATWRGLGPIPESGLALREAFAHRDAARLPVEIPVSREPPGCRCGDVLKGTIAPPECPLFAGACHPDEPIGACMVSSEGTCAAWYRHDRWNEGAA